MNIRDFRQGAKAALPIVMGCVPIGMAFGVLATQAHLSVFEVLFMSLVVYAGSAQFIGVGMLAAGASYGAIIITTLLVNSRHLLMSTVLAPYMKKFSTGILFIIGFGVTDESFAVAMGDLVNGEKPPGYFLGLQLTTQFSWIVSTAVGAAAGNLIPNPESFGLHYALPAMFIGLLVIQIRGKLGIFVAVIAGMLSLLIKLNIPGNWNVILASIITATIGVTIEIWMEKSSRSSSV